MLTSIGTGFLWPQIPWRAYSATNIATGTAQTLDTVNEKIALIGHVYLNGRGTSKTFSAAGTGGSAAKIHWRAGAVTALTSPANIRVGLQNISNSAGPAAQPDGTFDVYTDLTSASSPTANAWNTATMSTDAAGEITISHGDQMCVVFDMTNVGVSGSVIVQGLATNVAQLMPGINTHNGTSWGTGGASFSPLVVLEFNDGTLATLAGSLPVIPANASTLTVSANPDELAAIFQVPVQCYIDMLWAELTLAGATSDYKLHLYSDPLGTPTLMVPISGSGTASYTGYGEHGASNNSRTMFHLLPSEVLLQPNTNYAVGIEATGAGNVIPRVLGLRDAADRALLWGTSFQLGQRQNGSGAFGTLSTTDILLAGVRISRIHDQRGGGQATYGLGI